MKKTLTILLSLLMMLAFAATCMASDNNVLAKNDKAQAHQKIKVKKELAQKYQEQIENEDLGTISQQPKDTQKHWAAHSVKLLYAAGLISGYPDNTFKPDSSITQAEIISLITKMADDEKLTNDTNDEDVDAKELDSVPVWAKASAKKASELGFLNLNRFHSNVQATRAQTAVWIAEAIGLKPVNVSEIPFKDGLQISQDDIGYIIALYQEKIIVGTPDGKFNPNSSITRAEIAVILDKVMADADENAVLAIDPKSATLKQGKSIDLNADINGTAEDNVVWSSSNSDLATVDKNGTVTAGDTKTGTAYIKATVTVDGVQETAYCKIEVVKNEEATNDASFKATGNTGIHDGKIYQEFKLMADGAPIDLSEGNVDSITMTKDNGDPVDLTPDSDKTLWFNIMKDKGTYKYEVKLDDGTVYEADIDWKTPEEVDAVDTHDSNDAHVIEYKIGDLNLSDADAIYQVNHDGDVAKLSDTDLSNNGNLLIDTNDSLNNGSTLLIYINGDWYTTAINF